MKERTGFVFDGDNREKQAAVAVGQEEYGPLDNYDQALQKLRHMAKISAAGHVPDDQMADFYAASALVNAILAVADAIYLQHGVTRGGAARPGTQ